MILILVGGSATGKTSVVRRLMQDVAGLAFLPSCTTRPVRASDLLGEYRYVDRDELVRRREAEEFVWSPDFDGYGYGTRREDLEEGLQTHTWRVAMLLPGPLAQLATLATGRLDRVRACHFQPPADRRVLGLRLAERGDAADSIARRLAAVDRLEEEVRGLRDIPFHPIEDQPLVLKVAAVKALLAP
jgi:guanylate kinase